MLITDAGFFFIYMTAWKAEEKKDGRIVRQRKKEEKNIFQLASAIILFSCHLFLLFFFFISSSIIIVRDFKYVFRLRNFPVALDKSILELVLFKR